MSNVDRLFGRAAPKPVPNCPECAGWAALRKDLRDRRDLSGVSDVNVLIRDHQEKAHSEQ